MILLLSALDDGIVDLVGRRLKARGASFLRFDDAEFPDKARISVRYSPARGLTHQLQANGATIDLDQIRVAWDHRPGKPQPSQTLPSRSQRFATIDSGRFMDDMWRSLECRWVPAHKDIVLRVQHKASQLKKAQQLGFEIPQTVVTNDPAEFREFYRQQNGRVISKVFHRSVHRPDNDADEASAALCMTQLVSNRDVGHAEAIRHSPVIFQAYVPKQLELRITIIGSRVLAAAIHSQGTHRTRHDWRHADLSHTRYTPFDLPAEIESRCIQIMEQFGLCFGALDMVLTPDGRYVFLEINPSGQWRWVETMSGLPIADTMAQFLLDADAA